MISRTVVDRYGLGQAPIRYLSSALWSPHFSFPPPTPHPLPHLEPLGPARQVLLTELAALLVLVHTEHAEGAVAAGRQQPQAALSKGGGGEREEEGGGRARLECARSLVLLADTHVCRRPPPTHVHLCRAYAYRRQALLVLPAWPPQTAIPAPPPSRPAPRPPTTYTHTHTHTHAHTLPHLAVVAHQCGRRGVPRPEPQQPRRCVRPRVEHPVLEAVVRGGGHKQRLARKPVQRQLDGEGG